MSKQKIIETIQKKLKKAEDLLQWAKCNYFDSTTRRQQDYYFYIWDGAQTEVTVLSQLLEEIE